MYIKNQLRYKHFSWSSPWLIAFIPLLIILVLSNGYFTKYKLKLISKEYAQNRYYCYSDLNHDGTSEFLQFSTYQNAEVLVKNFDQKLEEVYSLPGKWLNGRREIPVFYFGDFDGDNIDEIFAFTVNNNDSLHISVIKHYPDKKIIKQKFIAILPKIKNAYDYNFLPLALEDNNGDKSPEFIFTINAGYSLQPRAVYAWDLKNDTIYHSPLMGVAIKSLPKTSYLKDVNGDSIKEIFLHTVAVDNYSSPIPFDDHNSWIMVFTKNLNFLFEPIKIPGEQTHLFHFPFYNQKNAGVGVFFYSERQKKNEFPSFLFYNTKGKEIEKISLGRNKDYKVANFYIQSNTNYLVFEKNGSIEIQTLSSSFKNITNKRVIPGINRGLTYCDIDLDGKDEIIAYSEIDKKAIVFRKGFKHAVETNIGITENNRGVYSSVAIKNNKPEFFPFLANNSLNYLKYTQNPLYYLNFILAVFFYFLLVFVFSQLKRIWLKNLIQKQQTEQEMQNLQMQTVMNQLNPHFTFNAINTVGSAILEKDTQKAYDSLTRVSRLFRRVVDQAYQPYKTLGQEIEFVQDYLDVEQTRFGDKLKYEITVEEGVDRTIKIPKMLIQLFVENSIKHGLFHKKDGGKINIHISQEKESIKITIEDNGLGRQKAAEFTSDGTGKGMLILENYLKLFKEQYNREITFKVNDVVKNNEVCGTRVEIMVQN